MSSVFTWGKCLTTASNDGSGFRIDNLSRFSLYGPCAFNIPLNLTFNYVYELPGPARWGALNNVATRALFDGWQISGITTFRNGTPYSPTFSVPGYGNAQLTGSGSQGARVWLVGDPLVGTILCRRPDCRCVRGGKMRSLGTRAWGREGVRLPNHAGSRILGGLGPLP